MTTYDEIIESIPVLKQAWDKYMSCINTTTKNPVSMYIKVDIPYSDWTTHRGEIRFDSDGISVYNMSTDVELVKLQITNGCDSFSSIEEKYSKLDCWRDEPFILKFGENWNSDYVYYEGDSIITDKSTEDEITKEDLESILFQKSTISGDIFSMQVLEEHMRIYDYANSELIKNNASYLGAYTLFKGYSNICNTIMQTFK